MNKMNRIIASEFIKYCLVGVINTIVGISTALICLNFFRLNYGISTGAAFIIGNITSFYLNKKYSFKNKDKSLFQVIKFFLTMLPAYTFSYWLGYKTAICFSDFLEIFINYVMSVMQMPYERVIDNLAILISIVIYLFLGFSINKFFVFKMQK